LIAEIGTGLMETQLGFPHSHDQTNYNKYLDEWLAEMKKNPKYIFDAATQASRSLDYLLSFTKGEAVDEES
jgi:antirestriction protein ArdC